MTSPDDGFHSISGVLESAEPAETASPHDPPADSKSKPAAQDTPASMPHKTFAGARPLNVSGPPSSTNSHSSREASPARPLQRTNPATNAKSNFRSRKSSTDVSPSRGPTLPAASTTAPSAAAIQRALSATSIPELPPNASSDKPRVSRPQKAASGSNSGDNTPHWPISPRLRSPPPSEDGRSRSRTNSLRSQIKKPEAQSTPAIVVQSSSPASLSRFPVRDEAAGSDPDEPVLSMKGASRGPSGVAPKLETVQESSLPATPGFDGLEVQSFVPASSSSHKGSDEERNDVSLSKITEDLSSKSNNKSAESGSDSGNKAVKQGKTQEQRVASQQHSTISSKPSISSLSNRSRMDPPLRNMTVETETVPSVAQSTIGTQDRSASGRADGSVRLKPSNETIRPKKERKTPKRKAPSINSGTASSKADVFEQKVASAVDEADSSDSDATFIYESQPHPEQPVRSRQHHHSRTPSMTSVTSLIDPRVAIRDAHKNPNKKSSMKFTNPYNNPSIDGDSLDRGEGTVRSGSVRGGAVHHHHIGRHGQGRGGLGHLMLDSDGSIAQSSRARGPSSRQASQPNSPRFHTFNVGNGNGNGIKKHGEYSSYDLDTENAADDERTPLLPSGRSPRVRTPRQRNNATIRQLERRHRHGGGWCRRFAGCLVLSILLLVVVFSSVGLVFATTKPLGSLKIEEMQNVVASQDELLFDVIVMASNPNIIGVTISDVDVTIFAKSKHVGSDKWWREHGNDSHDHKDDWQLVDDLPYSADQAIVPDGGTDEGTDPIDDGEPRTMTLGHISHFESPLIFDGHFFDGHFLDGRPTSSIGEMRLPHPGNRSETGGTERWEEVLQYPFEIIVRGIFKYALPLSTREHRVSVISTYYYDPGLEKKLINVQKKESESDSPRTVPSKPFGRYDRRAS